MKLNPGGYIGEALQASAESAKSKSCGGIYTAQDEIAFTVPGIPAPGGSKRAFALKRNGQYTGRVAVSDAAGERNANWRQAVSFYAREAYDGPLLECPLRVTMTFYMPRPKGHSGKRGLRPSAPRYPVTKPDVLKLARSTEDAMSGIIWKDDNTTVDLILRKRYASDEHKPGAVIRIEPLNGASDE